MPVAKTVKENLEKSSWIRKMFEEGAKLKAQFGAENVYDFSLGNPDLEPPQEFLNALKEAANSTEQGTHGYMPNPGYPFARAALAEKVSLEHAVSASADDLVITVGAAGALNVVFKTILNPGDEVLVVRPYFAEYGFYITNHQGVMKIVDSAPDFSLDSNAVAAALTAKTAAIIINTPNNPSGKVYSRKDIESLAAVLSAHGNASGRMPYLLIDEPYRDIVYDGIVAPPILDAYPESIVISSFSKNLSLPGERIGYIGLNPRIDDKATLMAGLAMANRILGFVNAPALMQRVVSKSWKAKADVNRYRSRRDMFTKILDEVKLEYAKPEGAFYLFCKVPESPRANADGNPSDVNFAMHLKTVNILAVPGSGFGYQGWVRLSYCVPEASINGSAKAWAEALKNW